MSAKFEDYSDGRQYIALRVPFLIDRDQLACSLRLDHVCHSREELATLSVTKDQAIKSIRGNLWQFGVDFHYKAEDAPAHVEQWAAEQIARLFPKE